MAKENKRRPARKRSGGKPVPPPANGVFAVGFHQGNVLSYLASNYRTISQVVLEMVQNFIDKKATEAIVHLRLGNRRKNLLHVQDNGLGASKEEMELRIGNIAAHQKTRGQIGHKGIGNLAPLAISKGYSMITRPNRSEPYFMVKFSGDNTKSEDVGFEWQDMDLTWAPTGGRQISTVVSVKSIEPTAIRELVKADNPAKMLADEIADHFGGRIQEAGISITVKVETDGSGTRVHRVTPKVFPGIREDVEISTPHGPVVFEMYRTHNRQNNPVFLVQHQNGWTFPINKMSDVFLPGEDVFKSGYLQGYIKLNFCKLTPDRQGFEWGDDFESFSQAVNEFIERYGRPFLDSMEVELRQEGWEDIARKVLDQFRAMSKINPDLLPKDFLGLVSDSHGNDRPSKDDSTKRRTKAKKERGPAEEELDTPTLKPTKEKNIDHHSVQSTSGSRRRRIKGQPGLTIEFSEGDPERGYKWRVLVEDGAIVFNTAHKDWAAAEDGGKLRLRTYMVFLLANVLVLPSLPDDWVEVFSTVLQDEYMKFLDLFVPQFGRRKK